MELTNHDVRTIGWMMIKHIQAEPLQEMCVLSFESCVATDLAQLMMNFDGALWIRELYHRPLFTVCVCWNKSLLLQPLQRSYLKILEVPLVHASWDVITLSHGCANHATAGETLQSPIQCCDITNPPYLFSGELCTSSLHYKRLFVYIVCCRRAVSASLCLEHVNQMSHWHSGDSSGRGHVTEQWHNVPLLRTRALSRKCSRLTQ